MALNIGCFIIFELCHFKNFSSHRTSELQFCSSPWDTRQETAWPCDLHNCELIKWGFLKCVWWCVVQPWEADTLGRCCYVACRGNNMCRVARWTVPGLKLTVVQANNWDASMCSTTSTLCSPHQLGTWTRSIGSSSPVQRRGHQGSKHRVVCLRSGTSQGLNPKLTPGSMFRAVISVPISKVAWFTLFTFAT